MMKRLDNRGVAAFEFCLVVAALLMILFTIFDLGRYAITMQSLRALASAGARATMIDCYTPNVTDEPSAGTSAASCTDIDAYLPEGERADHAPFLYGKDYTPTLSTTAEASALSITATVQFAPVLPWIWGTSLASPAATTKLPF